ncbi:class II aldolase/adducin family protein [Mesorhizobium sp. M0276]|uniref:class II aldolase/adducin family protein n=1 Tax=Mesorhizobium sp. M0276 TaxID=2956928 RepID=UPI0033386A01
MLERESHCIGRTASTRGRSRSSGRGQAHRTCIAIPEPAVSGFHRSRGVYRATHHEAVVHCHSRDATAIALLMDVIRPLQIEGHACFRA